VEADRLALLLDGLDEVEASRRGACVRAINAFRAERGFVPIAVACRKTDYEALPERLKLDAAIQLRALTRAQIDGYLAAAGPRLAPLVRALEADPELADLAGSPLMLHVMSLSYADGEGSSGGAAPAAAGATTDGGSRREALFDRYVERMFARRAGHLPFGAERTKQALTWLASDLESNCETIFSLEHMQPTSLPRAWRFAYFAVTRVAIAGLFCSFFTVNGGPLLIRVSLGIATGLTLAALDYRLSTLPTQASRTWPKKIASFFAMLALTTPVPAAVFALQFELQGGEPLDWKEVVISFAVGLAVSLPLTLVLASRRERLRAGCEIRTVESIRPRLGRFALWAALLAVAPALAAWVPLRGGVPARVTAYCVEGGALRATASVPVRATSASLTADGRALYVTPEDAAGVMRVDLTSGAARPTGVEGQLVLDERGASAVTYRSGEAGWRVQIRDPETLAEVMTLGPPSGVPRLARVTSAAYTPRGLLVSADGASVLLDLSRVSRETAARPDVAVVGRFDSYVVVSPDGAHALSRSESGALSVFDLAGAAAPSPVALGDMRVSASFDDVAIASSGAWFAVSKGDCVERFEMAAPHARRALPTSACEAGAKRDDAKDDASLAFVRGTDRLVAAQRAGIVVFAPSGAVERTIPFAARAIAVGPTVVAAISPDALAVYRVDDGALVSRAALPRNATPGSGESVVLALDERTVVAIRSSVPELAVALGLLFTGLFIALFLSLEPGVVRQKTGVNEGIHRTAARALLVAAALAVVGATLDYVSDTLIAPVGGVSLKNCLEVGAVTGMAFGLGFGGVDLVSHYLLRGMLALRGDVPARVAALCDSAVQLVFLRRVGGGYIFIHRLVLEHFAAFARRATPSSSSSSAPPPGRVAPS
jgi:hypothetical protein